MMLTLGSGIYGTAFWVMRDRGPTRAEHQLASAKLRQEFKAKDMIILAPHYATLAREFLGDLHPVATREPLNLDWKLTQNRA